MKKIVEFIRYHFDEPVALLLWLVAFLFIMAVSFGLGCPR